MCYEKKWDVSVEGRLERVLNPLKIFTKSTFKTHNTSINSSELVSVLSVSFIFNFPFRSNII